METITLHVDEASARAWNNSPPLLRAAYEKKISAILKEMPQSEVIDEPEFTKEQLEFLKAENADIQEPYEWWDDESLVSELERRSADLKSGRDPGISWEETKKQLMSRLKK